MKKNIFREYDIRGIVGSELLLEESFDLGRAIISYLKKNNSSMNAVIVGNDGRAHSEPLKKGIVQAILEAGIDVIDIGLSPTPAMYFAIYRLDNPFGITITASHNPKEYNGVKIWGLWGHHIQAIQALYESKEFLPKAQVLGMHTHVNIIDDYISYLEKSFSHLKGKSINAVVDCGNGSAGIVFPQLVKNLGLKNINFLFPEVDGNFPNHEADPTVPENMTYVKDELEKNPSLSFGIGFDGDCDRMNPMTKNGTLVPGDQLLALFAQQALEKSIDRRVVVFDIKSSSGLVELLHKWNAQPIMSPSGHTYIKQNMKAHNALLGGELSCHFFFADRYFGYDDGIYAALRLFEMIALTEKDLSTLLEIFPHKVASPEIRISCKDDEKTTIIDHVKQIFAARSDVESITVDGIRAIMPYGWGLARASNTQPVICLRFEASNSTDLNHIKQDFLEALTPYFDHNLLKERIDLGE